jgi:N-acetylglucosamine repressor
LLGHSGLAGELGHITAVLDGLPCGCGNRGCLETVATDSALAAALSRRLERPVDVAEALRRVQERDPTVAADLERVSEFQAIALAAVINVFNPEVVFVYTRLLDADDATFERVKERTRERSLTPSFADCRIERARGNKSLGAVAAILTHLTDSHAPTLEG